MHINRCVHKHGIKEVREENGMERRRRTLAWQGAIQQPASVAEARMDLWLR